MGMEKMKPVDKRLKKNSERKSPLSSLMSIVWNRPSGEKRVFYQHHFWYIARGDVEYGAVQR
jgi:hypothetical protein